MEPELARRLFAEGAVLVLLDVPQRTEFGIDYNSWSVGPKFKGVKMIPPGLHFVYYWCVFADPLVTFYRSVSVGQCREQAGRGSTENWLLSFLQTTGGKCSSEETAAHRDIVVCLRRFW